MKRSSFMGMILGAISVMFLGIGMCMALLPDWNAFKPGVVVGCVGLVFAMITVVVWRKMENKAPIRFSTKTVLTVLLGIAGALLLGIGMCFTMVWGRLAAGIILGVVGIILLLCLIPICKGIR